jgi:hypothetical protein
MSYPKREAPHTKRRRTEPINPDQIGAIRGTNSRRSGRGGGMYVIPLLLVLVVALAMLASPLLAVGLAIPLFLGFLVYVGLNRRADEKVEPSASEATSPDEGHESGGIWGER